MCVCVCVLGGTRKKRRREGVGCSSLGDVWTLTHTNKDPPSTDVFPINCEGRKIKPECGRLSGKNL